MHTASPFHYDAEDPDGKEHAQRSFTPLTLTIRDHPARRRRHSQYFEISHQRSVSLIPLRTIRPALTPLSSFSGNIKRLVLLSSTTAIGTSRVNEAYDEEEWNDSAVEEVKTKGKEANGLAKYKASKTLAERGEMIFI